MKKLLIVTLLPVALVVLSLLFVRSYQECSVYQTMVPFCDGPTIEQRGFIPFVQNGDILWIMVVVNYILWFLVTALTVVLVPKLYRKIKSKSRRK